jgi:chemotaxis protein CheX
MPTEIAVGVLPEELAQVVEAVFGTMLKLQVGESGKPWFAGEDRLTGTVHLTGDWSGAVLLECNQRQACGFAGHFLSMNPPEAVDDVVRDVLGELVNMIGGNLKCVLTRGIRLSMPSVVDGSQYSLRVCGVECEERLAFQCAEGLFWITVMTTRGVRGDILR